MVGKIKDMVTTPTEELGKVGRFIVFQIRIWFHCLRLLKVNRCGTQAAALAYHSIFGIVPLAIVVLMVFQIFPAFNEVRDKVKTMASDALYLNEITYPLQERSADAAGDDAEVKTITAADKLEELSESFISKASTGAITTVGLVLVIWAAISLLTTTERSFNNIFHVASGRGFLQRLFTYWALLTLGPVLIGFGIYASSHILLKSEFAQKIVSRVGAQNEVESVETPADAQEDLDTPPADANSLAAGNLQTDADTENIVEGFFYQILSQLMRLTPFFVSVGAFFLLYFYLPNTRVNWKSALWGAFVGTLLWTLAKIGFRYYLKNVPGFAVYGVLGIIPLTVMWIYVSWLIVLFGLQLTYATQHVKRLDAAEFAKMRRQSKCFLANGQTVIRVMEYVLNAFERKDQKPISVEAVAYRMGMPTDFTEKILDRMVQSGLLCRTDDPAVGYVPSTDGAHITLDEISLAISEVSFAQVDAKGPAKMREVFEELDKLLSRYTLKEVLNKEEDFRVDEDLMKETLGKNEPADS